MEEGNVLAGAIDIGGTSIKYGVLDDHGKILKKAKIPTDVKGGGQAILNQVKNSCVGIASRS